MGIVGVNEMMESLKKCPFCGGEAMPYMFNGNYGYTPDIYGIECTHCGATIEMSNGYANLSETVAKAWKRRITDERQSNDDV